MFFLVSNLVKSLVTTVNGAFEGFLTSVSPQVVEQALWLLEKFATIGMVTGVHSCLSLGIGVRITKESKLCEQTR